MQYHVTLALGEDGWYVVDCPACPGAISQGKTREEALANIKEAVEGWLLVWLEQHAEAPEDDPLVEIATIEVDVNDLRAELEAEKRAKVEAS